ncbi:MAG TPA: sugar ABC transporter ATP-binding protein [Gaiellaceae bacterium]
MTEPARDLLSIRGVHKRFAGTTALYDFDLDVAVGEVHALVGHNGSGKSTLVKILAGFHRPDDGTVSVAGGDLDLSSASAALEAGLRFVHQDLGLVSTLNTVENLALGVGFRTGAAGRIRWAEERDSARRRLRELGYEVDVTRPVGELAAAERTGIAIARALKDWENARVLVLDEPTAMLPRQEVGILFDAIDRVRRRGLAVIYVSHRLDEVFALAERVTVLRNGRKVATHPVADLDQARLVSLMVGDETLASHADTAPANREDGLLSVEALSGSVLRRVSIGADGGEIVGIAGLTGSGREEILPLIFGAGDRSGGEVRIGGVPLPGGHPKQAIAAGVAFLPADRHRLGSVTTLSVRENLTLTDLRRHSARFGSLRRRAERAEVLDWIEAIDVRPPDPDVPFSTLSGGNQQKVVLAKWLRMKPRVLLLDEPTQGVDVHAKAVIHRLARTAADDGAAVVIASSDDAELCDTCDRVVVVRDGQVAAHLDGRRITPSELGRLELGRAA